MNRLEHADMVLTEMKEILDKAEGPIVPVYAPGAGVNHKGYGTGHITQVRKCNCGQSDCSGTIYTVRFDTGRPAYYLERQDMELWPDADVDEPIIDFPQIIESGSAWHYYWIGLNAWAMHGCPLIGYRFVSFGGPEVHGDIAIDHEQVLGRLFRARISLCCSTTGSSMAYLTRHGVDLERKGQPPKKK